MSRRPKPPMAAWIARERKRLDLKPADVAGRLRALGLEASEQTVRVWESYANRRPSPENIDGLERIFGTRSPEAEESAQDVAAVVAAIDRLTDAVRAQGQQQMDGMTALAEVLGVVLARLGGLPERTPDESAEQLAEAGR